MSLQTKGRTPFAAKLDLPPPFTLVTLREVGDAFAHAVEIAPEQGAGTLVYVGRFDLAEFAVVLEPDEPLRTARRALYLGMAALIDALLSSCAAGKADRRSTGRMRSASTAGWSAAAGSPGRRARARTSRRTGWCSAR